MGLGLISYGTISKKKKIYWETQLFAFLRSFKDGVTFFDVKMNLDLYDGEHSPAFQLEITILNCYNHIWIYKNS